MSNHDKNSSPKPKTNGYTIASLTLWGLTVADVLFFFTQLTPIPLIGFQGLSVLGLGVAAAVLGYMGGDVSAEQRTAESIPSLWADTNKAGTKSSSLKPNEIRPDDKYTRDALSVGRIMGIVFVLIIVVAIIQFIEFSYRMSHY